MVRTFRDEAVVLRTHRLGEADRIITMLTAENGQIRAVAKGIRRTSSKFGARLEPFSVIDVQLYQGRGSLATVTQVETIASHGQAIAADYGLFTPASVIVETAERLSADTAEGSHAQYLLLVGALYALARARHEPSMILSSYLLRALAIAGWAPSCFECAVCGAPGPHTSFSIPEGGIVCDHCRPAGTPRPPLPVLELMGDLLSGDWHAIMGKKRESCRSAVDIVCAYTQWHLERRLRSMRILEQSGTF